MLTQLACWAGRRKPVMGTSLLIPHALAVPSPPTPLQAVVTLPVQYRMAADIMALPNALIYGDALRCGTGGCMGSMH